MIFQVSSGGCGGRCDATGRVPIVAFHEVAHVAGGGLKFAAWVVLAVVRKIFWGRWDGAHPSRETPFRSPG